MDLMMLSWWWAISTSTITIPSASWTSRAKALRLRRNPGGGGADGTIHRLSGGDGFTSPEAEAGSTGAWVAAHVMVFLRPMASVACNVPP